MSDKKKFVLGSGELFALEYTGAIPSDEIIETEENRLGLISGGATIEYKPNFYTVEDDIGLCKEPILTSEALTLKTGVMTPDMSFVDKAAPTVKTTTAANTKTTKIGGLKNADGKKYLVRFKHVPAANPDYNLRFTMIGVNQSGFSLGMVKDKEVIVDMEFAATPMDNTGALGRFDEPAALEGGA
ncbi:hypothetical protein RWV98_02970 [Agathobaculum sp. NTUH-O15-33]|uniref:hypothetical protein n=1 Tax=Agathobaculum sp. NTUH-O15-33 TaxID=3079302 RepID=UPI0029588583|nr:hypothetical protein [Agathobaculum sp. NTUH-O15-33]WNX85254.1 hypothetical protein RWV98_02970 [Agathobaculum sp. NTUH-O15-33]